MATIALAGLGAAYGSLAGGLTLLQGLNIGAAIGGYIDAANNMPSVETGRLTDLRVGSSSYGTRLPWAWGRVTLPGSLIWAARDANGNHLRESRNSTRVGGKGGGGATQTTYSYSSTFAIAVAQSSIFLPDPTISAGGTFSHRNPALMRVRADDVVIYDSTAAVNIVVPTWHDGDESQTVNSTIASLESDSPAYQGTAYFVLTDLQLSDFGNRIPSFSVDIETDPVTVGDILSDLFQSVGLLPAEFDVAAATASVPGFVVTSRASIRDAVNQLLVAYGYDLVEVDGKLTVVAKGGSSIATISAGELAATSGGSPVATLNRSRGMASELPGRVDVSFYDAEASNQAGLQSDVRQTADVDNVSTIALAISMTGDEAREIAARELDRAYIEADRYGFTLPPKYLYLAPADVVTVPTNTGDVRVRVTRLGLAPLGEVKVEAVADSAAVITQSLPGGTSTPSAPATYEVVPTTFATWSGREILDAHQESAGFYVVAAGPSGWSGCTVYYSVDAGATWIPGGDISRTSAFGLATITNYAGASGTVGGSASIAVTLDSQTFLESCSSAEVVQGVNWAYVGGEIVGIRDYTLTGALTYTGGTITRGLRSTPSNSHGSNELFVALSTDALRISVADAYVATSIQVKCVSRFQTIADVTAQSVTIAARTPLVVDNLQNMSFVTLGTSAATPNERVLTAGTGVSITDGGAGGAVTVAVVPPGSSRQLLANDGGALGVAANLSAYPDNGAMLRSATVFAAFRTVAVGSATGADNGSYVDIASSVNDGVFNVFNGGAVLNRIYFGWENCLPRQLRSYNSSGNNGVAGVVLWEIWNGSAWVTITGNNLTSDGGNITIPTTATSKATVNGVSAYWIRATVSTAFTTAPNFRFLRNPQASNLPANGNPAMYTTGLFIAPASTPQAILNTVIGGGTGATSIISAIGYGNGEQNILQVYSSLTGGSLFSIGGDGTISAGGADNTFRNLTLAGGASNQNAVLTLTNGSKLQASWLTDGAFFRSLAATRTNSSSAGTYATSVFHSFGTPTLAAANAGTTTTVAANVYIAGAVAAGTNMTIVDSYALWVAAGRSRFDGELIANGRVSSTGVVTAISTKTTAYTLTNDDRVILGNTSTAGFTLTLPTAAGRTGQTYTIKKISSDANTLTVATTSAQTIDGAATLATATQYARWTVVSDGANWQVIG